MDAEPLAYRWWWSLLLFGLCVWWVVAFWPGQLDIDSLDQIFQGRTGMYEDWHPPLMAGLGLVLVLVENKNEREGVFSALGR